MTPQINGDLSAVYQFCYLRGSGEDFKAGQVGAVAVFPNACGIAETSLPQENPVKYLVKLFIDLGGKVFPVLCSFLCRQAF